MIRDPRGELCQIRGVMWILAVVGTTVTVAALIYAAWARRNPRTDSEVRFATRHRRIAPVGKWPQEDTDISIRFAAQPVLFVDEMVVSFRNYGPSRLNADDEEDQVIVHLPEQSGKILRLESDCAEQLDERSIRIRLLPMHVDDVRQATILHDIPNVDANSVTVTGQLRGVPHGIQKGEAKPGQSRLVRVASLGNRFSWILGVVLVWGMFALIANTGTAADRYSANEKILITLLGPLFLIVSFLVLALTAGSVLFPIMKLRQRYVVRHSPFGPEQT